MSEPQKDQVKKESADFQNIGDFISETVELALREARMGIKKGEYQIKKNIKAAKMTGGVKDASPAPKRVYAPVAKSPKGSYAGPLYIAGGFLTGAIGLGLVLTGYSLVKYIFAFGFLAFTGYCLGKSAFIKKRLERFHKYVERLSGRAYIEIKELADAVGKSVKYVTRDLNKMIEQKMFPEGRLTDDKKILLLSDDAYKAYCQMKEGEELKAREEAKRRAMEEANPIYKEVNAVIAEGEAAIEQIRAVNHAVVNEDIRRKLERLEVVLKKIFDYVQDNPDQLSSIRRFMGFYLPTTLKLVNAYKELDDQAVQGPNIVTAKQEIEDQLDKINIAFEKLYDDLYQDTTMDISTDISVMNNFFAQEGLTEDAGIRQ